MSDSKKPIEEAHAKARLEEVEQRRRLRAQAGAVVPILEKGGWITPKEEEHRRLLRERPGSIIGEEGSSDIEYLPCSCGCHDGAAACSHWDGECCTQKGADRDELV